jgi:hypothetical protein
MKIWLYFHDGERCVSRVYELAQVPRIGEMFDLRSDGLEGSERYVVVKDVVYDPSDPLGEVAVRIVPRSALSLRRLADLLLDGGGSAWRDDIDFQPAF